MRVLITGMGGELGTRVANLLEADPGIDEIVGMDIDPPRRRITRTEFFRVDPRDRSRTDAVVRDLAPTAVIHIGTYEPYARSSPRSAVERTAAGSLAVFEAAVAAGALEQVVVRSGISVYGKRPGAPVRPDESVPPRPSTPWGHSLLHAELVARHAGRAAGGAPVTLLRMAPLVGPHFPSPLGRLLRLPMVPVHLPRDPAFSVLHQEDAAAALVAALRRAHDGPVNVVGPGAVTASGAARTGGRLPVPVVGPGWRVARLVAEVVGAPVPEHIAELLRAGRTADGTSAASLIGVAPRHRTAQVIERLYEWSEVEFLDPATGRAA